MKKLMQNPKILFLILLPLFCFVYAVIKGFFLGGIFLASIIYIIFYEVFHIEKILPPRDNPYDDHPLESIWKFSVFIVIINIIIAILPGRQGIPMWDGFGWFYTF